MSFSPIFQIESHEKEKRLKKYVGIFDNYASYVLSMFMYTSGEMHMGHVRNFSVGDTIANILEMNGIKVFQPIGWDAFGLPAENAAITHKTLPSKWTYSNIQQMKKQLLEFAFGHNWDTEIVTCDDSYYIHTQKIIQWLFQHNLLYSGYKQMPFCHTCDTVLSKEQSLGDICWRCGNKCAKVNTNQWFVKTSQYSKRLYDDLDTLSGWPKNVISMQKNWIGYYEYSFAVYTKYTNQKLGYTYINPLNFNANISYSIICKEKDNVLVLRHKKFEDIEIKLALDGKRLSLHEYTTESRFVSSLEDWCISRQRYWGVPLPIIKCHKCGFISPDDLKMFHLPNEEEKYSSILSDQYCQVNCPKCSFPALKEPHTLDTFVCSAWYMWRYTDSKNTSEPFKYCNRNINIYVGGIEHATSHLLYSRFITKFLYDIGKVSFHEISSHLVCQGLILAKTHFCNHCMKYVNNRKLNCHICNGLVQVSNEKMSKTKLNGVSTSEMVHKYGSDAIRMYVMFVNTVTQNFVWQENGVRGMYRFISKVYFFIENVQLNYTDNNLYAYRVWYTKAMKIFNSLSQSIYRELNLNYYVAQVFVLFKEITLCNSRFLPNMIRIFLKILYVFAPLCANYCFKKVFQEEINDQNGMHKEKNDNYLIKEIVYKVLSNQKFIGKISCKDIPQSKEEVIKIIQEQIDEAKNISIQKCNIYISNNTISIVDKDEK